MRVPVEYVRKAYALVIRLNANQFDELLVLSFKSIDYPFFRLPGGNVKQNENPLEALLREIREETGLTELTMIREPGVIKYF
jgi:ADP-ribose pyrophosphatase YjhB (NUDIX family)